MSTPEELIPFCEHPFFESAAKLLSEPDPGPTPFLVDELIVERMIAVLVAQAKRWKTWTLLDLGIAIVTGEKALGRGERRRSK